MLGLISALALQEKENFVDPFLPLICSTLTLG
jgi:hypothetical protein